MTLREEVLAIASAQYGTQPEYLWTKYPSYAVLRHPNKKWYAVAMLLPRAKLGLPGEGTMDVLNVKCDAILSGVLRTQPGFHPAYHMNKEQWITVQLDGTVDLEQLRTLLDISYRTVGEKTKKKKPRIPPKKETLP